MKKLLLLAFATLLLANCTSPNDTPPEKPPVTPEETTPEGPVPEEEGIELRRYVAFELGANQAAIVEKQIDFSFAVASAVAQQSAEDNLIISPFSLYSALSLLTNGATEQTKTELNTAMGLTNIATDDLNSFNRDFSQYLTQVDNVSTLANSNALFPKQGLEIYESYSTQLKEFYNATVQNVDYTTIEAQQTIDNWVDVATKGVIKKTPIQFAADTELALLNALYFNGKWDKKFNKELTKKELFTNANGSSQEVEMMNSESLSAYFEDNNAKYLKLEYGNGAFNMLLMLPSEGTTNDQLLATLNSTLWSTIISPRPPKEVTLKLPKFKINAPRIDLKQTLNDMGIVRAFSPDAQFGDISPTKLVVSEVVQGANFELDEEGSTAAAVTVIAMDIENGGEDEYQKVEFLANRPFAFAIYEQSTKNILFIGKVDTL